MIELSKISTEQANPRSAHIDRMSTAEILYLINDEDQKVAPAVREIVPDIERAVNGIFEKMQGGGRLIYIGSGTSGRLGVLDAAECPPTYGTDPKDVVALIAGGPDAMFVAQEGAEDDFEQGKLDLAQIGLSADDAVVGLAASGRTPYVVGGLEYANSLGALTVSVSSVEGSPVGETAQIALTPKTGPEVVTGSTRMKNGTAQKLILNMITTTVMIKSGKVYGNLMVDLKATNKKLHERATRTVMKLTGVDRARAKELLDAAGMHVKTAVVMAWLDLSAEEAVEALHRAGGHMHHLEPADRDGVES